MEITNNSDDDDKQINQVKIQPIVDQVKALGEQIAKDIESKYEPIDRLQEINQLLNQYHNQIWTLLSKSQESGSRKEFIEKVFKSISEKMLNEKILSKPTYLPEILKFFRNILVNYFPKEIEEESLAEVVHSIFNLEASLYTSALQSKGYQKNGPSGQSDSPDGNMSLEQKRVLSENEWRENLKVGDKLDCIKMRPVQTYKIHSWSRAEIVAFSQFDPTLISVQFENESESYHLAKKEVSRYSPDIAPLGTFTDDFDWRYDLKSGDEVDSLDSEGVWYRSTALDTRTHKYDGKEYKEVYVGYRVYEKEGHKTDDDGRRFVGWSNKYDDWKSATCPTIQRLNTMCKYYQIAGKATMMYDNVVEDLNDIIYNTKERKVWAVYRQNFFANLKCIPDYLNEFGQRKGFDKIIAFMNQQDPFKKVTLRHLFYLVDFLFKTQPLWQKQFACYYIPQIKEAVEKCLLQTNPQMSGPLQQKFNRETLISIQRGYQGILRRHYHQDIHGYYLAELQFSIGFTLLNSDKLEARIQGFKEIIEQIKAPKYANVKRPFDPKDIIRRLKKEDIFDKIFGESYHIQLIQRSKDLLTFLALEKQLGQREIDYIWSVTKRDQQTKMEIYKIIQDIATYFRQEENEMLVDRFATVSPDEFVEKEIECVYELSRTGMPGVKAKAANLFWEIATQVRPYRKTIIDTAIEKFIDLSRNWDREQKGEYIVKCLQNLENHKASLQSIKIMQKLLEMIPCYNIASQQSQYEFTNALISQYHILELIIQDINVYSLQANELWDKGILNANNIESMEVLNLQYSHRSHLSLRLNFIRQILQMAKIYIEQEWLDNIWDIMMEQSRISIDSDIFFDWLKLNLNDNNKLLPEQMQHFFQTKVSSIKVNFKNIKKAGFDCICSLFLQINENENNLQVVSHYVSMNNQNAKLDFKINVEPSKLQGIEVIWKLFQDCDKKNNEITALIIDLLTKIYHNLSSVLEEKVHEIEDQFTSEALKRLTIIVEDPQILEEEKKQMCYITLHMMKSFFEDSEKNGTGNLRPHMAIERGDFLQNIVIQNNITSQKTCPKIITLSTYSNMTIWELKKIVAVKTKTSPLKIQINRSDNKKNNILDQHNMRMLRELHLESYEVLIAQKKPMIYTSRVPLVNKQQQLMPDARKIFEQWFDTFSTEGFMTPETCVDFIKSSTNDQTVNVTDTRVTRLFNEYDKDGDGNLNKEEFLEFYRDKSFNKPELVWKDDPLEVSDQSVLPRYKLSTSMEIFDLLFSLIEKLSNGGQDDIWSLITQLRTNPTVYNDLLNQKLIGELGKENTSVYKQLYCLQIMQQFIDEYSVSKKCQITCYFQQENQIQEDDNPQNNNDATSQSHNDKMNIAPKSGEAIPLPAQSQGAYSAKIGGNVPEPPSQGTMIGPQLPPANNQERDKVLEQLQNFRGQIITEPLESEEMQKLMLSTNELQKQSLSEELQLKLQTLRKQWVPNFIKNNGFSLLIKLLTNLNNKHKYKKSEDILKLKVERECLNQIMKVMKILVMSAFSSNEPNSELIDQLQRKMSAKDEQLEEQREEPKEEQPVQNKEENKEQDKNNKKNVKQEQEDLVKQYEPLKTLFQEQLGAYILQNLDFNAFQDQILAIIQLILKKKQIFQDDRVIIEQGLSLWMSCILFNADLLQRIYDEPEEDIESGKKRDTICSILIEEGLICENVSVRESFKETLLFICQAVQNQSLSEHPVFYFLKLLINELDLLEYKSRQSKQYFLLMRELLHRYFYYQKNNPFIFKKIFDTKELLQHFVFKLNTYKSKEQKKSVLEDTNLVGYISVITELINDDPSVLNQSEYHDILVEVIEKCLFTFDFKPIDSDITKQVDLQALEKSHLNKCLTGESREAAYNLLMTICNVQPHLVKDIISEYWYPMLFKVKKPKRAGYAPRTEGRSYLGYCGIKNLGCICYMNSMIQQFFHIPTFRYLLMATDDKQEPNWTDFEGDLVDDNMLHQLMKFMGFLELSERQEYNPREFCFSFKDFSGQPTNVRIQQDSQEFLNVAFDRIDNLLAKTSQKYLLQNVFGGKTCSLMICKSCGNLRQKHEDFYNLSLEVKNQKTIYESLKKFTSGEIINDFECEACGKRVDVERKTVIEKLPNTLIVHLQRIVFDFDTLMNQKLNSKVEFPNVLNLKPYMLSEVMKQEKEHLKQQQRENKKTEKELQMKSQQPKMEDEKTEESIDTNNKNQQDADNEQKSEQQNQIFQDQDSEMEDVEQNEEPDEDYQFKLVGVVVHMGTAEAGHYISFVNISRNNKPESSEDWLKTENEKWLEFNDTLVKDYRFQNLEEDCYGGNQSSLSTSNDFKNDYSRNAYMLIYEKRKKEQIKIVIPSEEVASSSLDCDGTAISRGPIYTFKQDIAHTNLFNAISRKCPPENILSLPNFKINDNQDCSQLLEKERNCQIFYDNENKEYYTLVDFNSIEKFVPNTYYKMVHEDNTMFLYEKQLFNNSFFKCTQQMLELLTEQAPQVLAETQESEKLFSFMDRLVFDLLAMTSENKQSSQLSKLFISMLDKNEKQTLNLIHNRILKLNQDKNQKDEKSFFDTFLSNMDKDIREMCQLFITFSINKMFEVGNMDVVNQIMNIAFGLIPEELTKNWLKITQYLSFLFDVTKSGPKQLFYMIQKNLITKLIDFFLENESPLAIGQRRNLMGSNYANPPLETVILIVSYIARNMKYIPKIDQEIGPVHIDQNRVSPLFLYSYADFNAMLSPEDIRMLQNKLFYNKAMKFGFECFELGRLVAHVSYENYEFSNRIAKKILVGINKSNGDDIQPYLDVLTTYLQFPDSLSEQRQEWILGIPQLKIERPQVYQQAQSSFKLGVQLMEAMNDDIFEYKSTLFKTSSTIKEALLQILYQYRRRWSKYSLLIIQTLLHVANNEPDGKIYKYMKLLEPPTYNYARYIDWIKPHLKDQIENCERNSHIMSYKQELEIAVNALSLYEFLEQKYEISNQQIKHQDQPVQQNQDEINEDIIYHDTEIGGPDPYLIWNVIDEKLIDQRDYDDSMITVIVRELNVAISESAPTGSKNLVISDETFLPQYQINQNRGIGNSQQNKGVVRKPMFGRGQQPQQARNMGHNIHSVVTKKAAQKAKRKMQVRPNPQNQQDQTIYSNQSPQDANQMDIDEQDGFESEEEIDTTKQTQDQDGVNDINEPNIYDQDQVQQDEAAQPQQPMQGTVPQIQNQQQDLNQVVNDNYWHAQSWSILIFSVINHDMNRAHKVTFNFLDKSSNQSQLNFRIPQTLIPCQVLSKREKDVIIFTKLRPFDEGWGMYDFEVKIEQPKGIKFNVQPPNREAQIFPDDDYRGNDQNQFMDPTNAQDDTVMVKTCLACTFDNPPQNTLCEVCNSGLPL